MAVIVQKIATARVQTQTGHPRSWTSAVFLLYPEVQAPEMRLLKSWTSWKLRLSVPASSSDLAHLLHLQDRGRLRFNVMAFRTFFHRVLRSDRVIHLNHASARTVAGWVARFEGSRDRSLSDRDQLVAFLKDEGSFCGPSNVARKGYCIVQLQEFLKDWHPPANSKYIVKQAAKGASTAGTTGGSRAITKAEMIEALGRRSDDFESYQACLFGAVAYLTVSRGIEILSLCPADLELLKNGDILLHIQRTKTILTGVKKRVPYVWLSAAFNPALALRRWVEGTHYLADDTPIWRVIVNGRLSRDKPLTAAHLRRVVKALFGPRTGLHSFRKGAASEMALSGVPLEVILSMGTWKDVTSLRSYVADAIRTNEDLTRRMNLSLLGPHF
ncbi:hypothetical protein J8273_7565 [Carpediemonas membranifera]|uniref:Tyr recombinase domain-containing protein n=1 Tax=Carpediemonas membranifera TaxID=201153 RepID=A0A8J6ASN5_9EUKA|nr:hypothetical protein J8273_7565 [Carpediemonas membranifera]|eukprot:KAG9391355.1 hypothetical protein J8273_7565 [Carpediemonas membranifera]